MAARLILTSTCSLIAGTVQFLVAYTLGALLGAVFQILQLIGIIKVLNGDEIPDCEESVVIAMNHPSEWEQFILMGFLAKQWLFQPGFAPWILADEYNLSKNIIWRFFMVRLVPIPRWKGSLKLGRSKDEYVTAMYNTMGRLRSILMCKRARMLIFPEGGQTGSVKTGHVWSRSKRFMMRQFKDLLGELAVVAKGGVLPICVQYSKETMWPLVTLKIGKRLHSREGEDPKRFAKRAERRVLALSDAKV